MNKIKEVIQMQKFSAGGVRGVIVNDPRANNEGLHNIRYRLTFNRERKYIPAGYAYSLIDWKRINSEKLKDGKLIRDRQALLREFEIIEEKVKEISIEGRVFTFELLFRKLARGDKNDAFNALDGKIIRLNAEGRIGSAVTYTSTLRSLWVFCNNYSGEIPFSKLYKNGSWLSKEYKKLSFENINEDFIKKYKEHLRSQGKSDATIGIYLRSLRSILNENDVPAHKYPFGKNKEKIPKGNSRKIALSKELVGIIAQQELTGNRALYRDLWLFSYLCNGANLKDIFRLKQRNIKGEFVCFIRAKTERVSNNPPEIAAWLHPEMKRIINQWGNNSGSKDEYLFPFLKDGISPVQLSGIVADYTKRINKTMKDIAKSVGLNANITLSAARHSHAVNSERSGQRTSLIAKALGHSDISTTVSYLASFDDKDIIDNSIKLL